MTPKSSLVISVNVGRPRIVEFHGELISTAIWKEPVDGRVEVRGINLSGDDQADRKVHGGHDKAVYVYAVEDYIWWEQQLGQRLAPGTFGENLTTTGLDVTNAVIGERWRVGTTFLEVAQPRIPCFKLGIRMDNPGFPRRFSLGRRPGAYLRIIEPGDVSARDPIAILARPEHGLTVEDVATIYYDESARAAELLDAPQLPAQWREWALERAEPGQGLAG